ncbi:MAG TPA: bifunctional [glutamine synthetase] adenylyltransferase/[glutamine synthetase]-adenylyl-L-tyrosine phosphorylase [Rhodobacteraceae bacterium]|nr:bifunctional [glutamine synthetase] adenylyltransferase/[glutamine synthetase]-adenylyl-L-tyrosine phosphorylase [Paracoccaceae bacterium]
MRLDQVQTAPKPFDPARGAEARALFNGLPEKLLDLIEGVAGSSAYLSASIQREADWLKQVSDAPLEDSFAALLHFEATSFQGLSDSLRIAKRRGALLIALADIGGLWLLEQVTDALTQLADTAVNTGLQFLVEAEAARGKLDADPAEAAGMFALAMGKMGAYELNYSSDIDLIILFDENRHPPENWGNLRAAFIRITKRLIKLLSENTAQGYVFRTDLRLRPDASVTPVCIATEPAENYYESLGRTWERAAFIKARACAGAVGAGEAFLQRLEPFIWRRYLDYAAIEDAHDMRLRIREHKGLHGPLRAAGHDMKLGQGGIREIEFFAQTQQIILGGKDRGLRMRGTLETLKALSEKGFLPDSAAQALRKAYIEHRTLEHRIQMLDDAQTHKIPTDDAKRQQLAMLCGFGSLAEFEALTVARLERVHQITEAFFNDDSKADTAELLWSAPERAAEITEGWLTYPALRSDRARRIFEQLKPQILASLCKAKNPDEALIQFDKFLRGLPSGVQVFSLFKANPGLLEMLIDICTMAPDLARYLGQNPRVLEAVISAEFFTEMPALSELKAELTTEISHCADYEQQLDATRIWAQEQRFRVGVHLLRGIADASETALAYSNIAEACVAGLFEAAVQQFSLRHGPPPGKGTAVIAMGKLGSREMTVSSDLDLIVVYDADGVAASEGKRPLPVQAYYARFTQALVSALTVSTSKGGLYEVDMRLRPSGRQGPVATSLGAFEGYQKTEAWVWEHMALLRSRVVAGPVADAVKTTILDVLNAAKNEDKVLQSLREMRARLAEAKSNTSVWDVKTGAGGLMDVELLLQAGGLLKGANPGLSAPDLAMSGWLSLGEAALVNAALGLYQKVQQVSRLAVQGAFNPANSGTGAARLLARTCGFENIAELEKALDETRTAMAGLIEHKLSGP